MFGSHLSLSSAYHRDPSSASSFTNRSPHLPPLPSNPVYPAHPEERREPRRAFTVYPEGPRERSRNDRSEGSAFRFTDDATWIMGNGSFSLNFPKSLNFFRMNTCESVSKQRTLTPFRMNTCEKGGRGYPIIVNLLPPLLSSNFHPAHARAATPPCAPSRPPTPPPRQTI